MKIDELVSTLIKNPKLFLIILGVIIVAIAGSRQIPILNLSIDANTGLIFKIMGVALVVIALFLLIKEDLKGSVTASEKDKDTRDYGIEITKITLSEKQLNSYNILVQGKLKELLPKNEELQCFHVHPGNGTEPKKYYPQKNPVTIFQNKTWEGHIKIGRMGNAFVLPKNASVMVARVGEPGKTLCHYYWQVVDETGKWIGIADDNFDKSIFMNSTSKSVLINGEFQEFSQENKV